MLREMSDLDSGAVITTDVAIIGGGPAGISIARQLSGGKRDVLLLESGGTDYDEKTQDLYKGWVSGEPYYPLDAARLRYFGGTSNHWGGHCRPLDPIDFERRSWVPHSGWPITRADLDPYYVKAQTLCELGPCLYNGADWPGATASLVPVDTQKLENRLWQYSPPTRFGDRYMPELRKSRNVTVLLKANVTDIVLAKDANSVEALVVKDLDGRTVRVQPRAVVLACGGIENARILLSSTGVEAAGVGNRYGLVGRYFMEHGSGILAFGVPFDTFDRKRFKIYWDSMQSGGAVIRAAIGVQYGVQRREHMLNGCIDIGYGYDRSEGYMALRRAKHALGGEGGGLGSAMLDVLGDLGGAAAGLYRAVRKEDMFWFGPEFEQEPDPDSRVRLALDRDALGMRRPVLDWKISKNTKRSIRKAMLMVGAEMSRLGLARIRVDDDLMDDDHPGWENLHGRYHHMGTTRMAADPRHGVVDADCRVHGVANLYVAGCSVFATSGYANPTLTLVALSLRLADHLEAVA